MVFCERTSPQATPSTGVHVRAGLTQAQRGNLGSMESLKPHAGVTGILKNNRGEEEHLVATPILPVIPTGQAGSLSYRWALLSGPIGY